MDLNPAALMQIPKRDHSVLSRWYPFHVGALSSWLLQACGVMTSRIELRASVIEPTVSSLPVRL